MESHEAYLQQAEQCERQAVTCEVEENRGILLATAATWRRMAAEVAANDQGLPQTATG
jgi:hypothetical protein